MVLFQKMNSDFIDIPLDFSPLLMELNPKAEVGFVTFSQLAAPFVKFLTLFRASYGVNFIQRVDIMTIHYKSNLSLAWH